MSHDPALLPNPRPAFPKHGAADWPTERWPEDAPGSDVDTEALADVRRQLIDGADPERVGETHALAIVHRGRLVFEAYGGENTADTTLISWSMAKSITHALVGVLVRDGKLDVDAPAPVEAWQGADDPRRAITTENLLRMESGLEFIEDYVDSDVSSVIDMLFGKGKADVAGYAAASPLAHEPRSYWSYSSGTSNIVARIAGDAVGGGQEGMWAFMQRELFHRIGMRSATARFDDAGTFIGSSFVFATARDFARFGLLYLREGVWEGEQLLPSGWADQARTLTRSSFDQYGAHWWLARDGSGIFNASGYNGQYIAVDPTRDLVLVRLGTTEEPKRVNVLPLLAKAVRAFPLLDG